MGGVQKFAFDTEWVESRVCVCSSFIAVFITPIFTVLWSLCVHKENVQRNVTVSSFECKDNLLFDSQILAI